jgi:Arc/MetJ-type ribon-helix-helix transcriptional regulator
VVRTAISIPDALAEQIRQRVGEPTHSEFARSALVGRVERLEREERAQAMCEGCAAGAASPSLDSEWAVTEIEGWE